MNFLFEVSMASVIGPLTHMENRTIVYVCQVVADEAPFRQKFSALVPAKIAKHCSLSPSSRACVPAHLSVRSSRVPGDRARPLSSLPIPPSLARSASLPSPSALPSSQHHFELPICMLICRETICNSYHGGLFFIMR